MVETFLVCKLHKCWKVFQHASAFSLKSLKTRTFLKRADNALKLFQRKQLLGGRLDGRTVYIRITFPQGAMHDNTSGCLSMRASAHLLSGKPTHSPVTVEYHHTNCFAIKKFWGLKPT